MYDRNFSPPNNGVESCFNNVNNIHIDTVSKESYITSSHRIVSQPGIMTKYDHLLQDYEKSYKRYCQLLDDIKELERHKEEYKQWLEEWRSVQIFEKKDWVFILNDILHPGSDDDDKTARTATVLYVKKDKRGRDLVFLRTDNGYKTRRAPVNLEKLRG